MLSLNEFIVVEDDKICKFDKDSGKSDTLVSVPEMKGVIQLLPASIS